MVAATGRWRRVFDEDAVAVGEAPRRGMLLSEVSDQRCSGGRLKMVAFAELCREIIVVQPTVELFEKLGDPLGDKTRTIELLRPPERRHGGSCTDGGNKHIIVGDLLDPPGLNPEGEGVAHRSLPDKLLVEFAEKGAAALDPELIVTAVGDGPSGKIDESLDPGSRTDRPVNRVDTHKRPQAADPAAGIATG